MDKTCLEIRDLMALGGDAAPNERIAIESHVSICADCARELSETRALAGNLALLREGDMPAGAAERIWRAVQPAVPQPKRAVFTAWAIRAAAALILGLSVGFTATTVGRSQPDSPVTSTLPDDTRPTIVPNGRITPGAIEAPPAEILPVPDPRPSQPAIQHYLPYVERIVEQGVIRF